MQIVQSRAMFHYGRDGARHSNVRIADSRDVRAASLDKWMGDSIGRWEGDTLIVEPSTITRANVSGRSTENLTVIETFAAKAKQDHLWFYSG